MEAAEDLAETTRDEGWEYVVTMYITNHPEHISRWYSLGAPILPLPEEIFSRRVTALVQKYPDEPRTELEEEVQAAIIGYGWPKATVEHRLAEG
jgi:hypothetical protein